MESPSSSVEHESMFSVDRLDGWRSAPGLRSVGVRIVAVGGCIVLIATSDGALVRWDTSTSAEGIEASSEVVEFARGTRPEGSRISSLFCDPSGAHALVCVTAAGAGQLFYVSKGEGRAPFAKELSGLRGHVVDAVAWSPAAATATATATATTTSHNTGATWEARARAFDQHETAGATSFLVGTAGGKVVLVRIDAGREREVTRVWEGAPNRVGGGPSPVAAILWLSHGVVSVLTRATLVWRTFHAPPGGVGGPREAFASPPVGSSARSEGVDAPCAAPGVFLRACDLALAPSGGERERGSSGGVSSSFFALLTAEGFALGTLPSPPKSGSLLTTTTGATATGTGTNPHPPASSSSSSSTPPSVTIRYPII